MRRIFLVLATLDGLALAATYAVGWLSRLSGSLTGGGPAFLLHFHLGLYTTVGNLAVHCLIFIYFLGTGRWVKEVALAYRLPDAPLPRLTRDLKRWTFPPALFAMLITIAAAAAGAGAQLQAWPWQVHLALATAALAVNAWAFVVEYRNVSKNGRVIDEILQEVERIRAEQGLPSSAEAFRQQEGVG